MKARIFAFVLLAAVLMATHGAEAARFMVHGR